MSGAARTRLATRESFFGGPLSTREQSKAPGWQAFVKKPLPEREVAAPKCVGGTKAGSKAGGGKQVKPREAAPPQPNPAEQRVEKLRQRRDFSDLGDEDPPSVPPPLPPPRGMGMAGRQQTAAGPPPRQRVAPGGGDGFAEPWQQQQQRKVEVKQAAGGGGGSLLSPQGRRRQQQQQQKVRVKQAAWGGGGKKAVAARNMAVEVTAAGKGRKLLASEALKQRVGEMITDRGGGGGRSAVGAGLGSPSGSGTGSGSGAAAPAAVVAAKQAAREAVNTKGVMQNKQFKTAHGLQTLQLVSRAPWQGTPERHGRGGGGGGACVAAMRASGAGHPGNSPGSVSKGQRPATGAGAPRAMQRGGAGGAAVGQRAQFRGAFYGGQQPPTALEARMQYNKRRLSLDSGGDLDSFIASDDEVEEQDEVQEDWRAALREATGGYDPSKFAAIDRQGDRDMEAAYGQIQAEERRAARIARAEDEREAEREALREAAKRERKRQKQGGAAAFVDDD